MSVGSRLGTSYTQDILLIGVLGLAAYVVYNLVQGVKKTADVAAGIAAAAAAAGQHVNDSVVNGLAKIITASTLPSDMVPTGAVRLPNGALIPASHIGQLIFDSSQNLAHFNYMGIDYQIAPQQWDTQGNLVASEVADFGLNTNASGGWS